jgi:hypothetical protein
MISQVVFNAKELRTALAKDLRQTIVDNHIEADSTKINEQVKEFMSNCAPKEYPTYVFIEFTFLRSMFGVDLFSSTLFISEDELKGLINDFKKPEIVKTNKIITIKDADVSDSIKDTL